MGEKLEDLGIITVSGRRFQVDANLGLPGRGGRDIHIQNDRYRFQLYEGKYLTFLAKILAADAKVKKSKGLK